MIKKRTRNIVKQTGVFVLAFYVVVMYFLQCTHLVYADYSFAMTSASKEGTVTITPLKGAGANGYYKLAGYEVTYTVTKDSWTAFDETTGGYFYVGNNLNPSAGCSFAYAPSGTLFEAGALQLGCIADARYIGNCNVNNNTVSCSFTVSDLNELPTYIGYGYHPASGAYIHLSEERGNHYHIWSYQTLRDAVVGDAPVIDTNGPGIEAVVAAVGTSVDRNGTTWAKSKQVKITVTDEKSGVKSISLSKNGSVTDSSSVPGYQNTVNWNVTVNENGTFAINATDNLGIAAATKQITVNGIDVTAPSVTLSATTPKEFCKENVLRVQASDNGSGLAADAYSWNGGNRTKQNTLTVARNGSYNITVYDVLGNQTKKSIAVSNIDNKAPVIEKMLPETEGFCKENRIMVTASDAESGLPETAYSWDGKTWTGQSGLEVSANGVYTVLVRDKLGNVASKSLEIDNVDNKPPVIEKVEKEITEKGTVRIVITATDGVDGSGLENEAYSFDGGKTWQELPYTVVDKNAEYKIAVRDTLGNTACDKIKITEVIDRKQEETDQKDDSKDDASKDNAAKEPEKVTEKEPNKEKADENTNRAEDDTPSQNPAVSTGAAPGGGIMQGQDVTGNGDGDDTEAEKGTTEKAKGDGEKNRDDTNDGYLFKIRRREVPDVSENEQTEVLLDEAEADFGEIIDFIEPEEKMLMTPVQKGLLGVLLATLLAGSIGLILYITLFLLKNTCVLYGIDDKGSREKLCRLMIRKYADDWQVKVPIHKLGTCGTGKYALCFHAAFAKEEEAETIIIVIDQRSIREEIKEEITFVV